jgi:ABC-2 type transport system permease protein
VNTSTSNPIREQSQFIVITYAFLAIFRRDLTVAFKDFFMNLIQAMVIPALFLFIFGRVVPATGAASIGYATLLLPGQIAMALLLNAMMNVTLPLVLDIGNEREIEDRLLAPLPVAFVAVEKTLFASLMSLVTSVFIFPLAYLILGTHYHVSIDAPSTLVALMLLSALAGSSLGLMLGTAVKAEQIGVLNAIILMPLIFLGCIFFSWSGLGSLKWFQIVTLFNPLTYSAEGLREVMAPGLPGNPLDLRWVFLGLIATIVVFLFLGIRGFIRRAVR